MRTDLKNAGSVCVLLSAYKPELRLFGEQLDSIDRQTYPLTLIVRNDSPDTNSLETFISEHIKRQSYMYIHGDKNLGYIKSFESLLASADSEFVIFCDQDDVWEQNRVEYALRHMLAQDSVLDVCDRCVIDKADNIITPSYRKSHRNSPEVSWKTGDDITIQAATVCYGIGMALMARTATAKSLIPFPESTAHDLWLTLGCSELGKCSFSEPPLVRYRRHGSNVSGFLANVDSKEDWYETRVKNRLDTARQFANRFPQSPHLEEILGFAEARNNRSVIGLIKYRKANPKIALIEILMKFTPDWIFRRLVKLVKMRQRQ